MLGHYGINDAFIIKTVIGLLTLCCGYFFVSALLNREKKPKEGVRSLRMVPLLIGAGLILITWYTDLPAYVSSLTGTDRFLAGNLKELVPIGTRIWVTVLTLSGVLLIKLGFYREDISKKEKKRNKKGKGEEDDSKLYDTIDEMGKEEY
jgi:hypothetical protein